MKSIPFYSLKYQHDQVRKELGVGFEDVVTSDWFILGDRLKTFEKQFASYQEVKYCVGVGNGFDALFLSLRALGISEGDEVIVPAHTYIATWLAVSRTGAIPVPVDADPVTWLIDTSLVEQAITSKTKAILPVHLYGLPCDMKALKKIAAKHGLKIIEDNAQATGASINETKTGSFGHCNAFSFYPTKNLGALGDGGAIVTDDEKIYESILALRNYGQKEKYNTKYKGVNSRLDEMQAAFLSSKLIWLDKWNAQRKELAKIYEQELAMIHDLKFPAKVHGADAVYHIFSILSSHRDQLKEFLFKLGIETMVHYPHLPYQQEAYHEWKVKEGLFPVAEAIAKQQLSLPIWPGMNADDVMLICRHIRSFYALVK